MVFASKRRVKLPAWLIWLIRGVILLVLFICFSPDIWRPWVDNWRCKKIASELAAQYGLVVRYGDPSEFFIPPTPPAVNDPEIGFFIGPANVHSARTALEGAQAALAQYPRGLIKKYLQAVFIPGELRIHNVAVGGTLFESWIYMSATPDSDPLGALMYEKTFHHELSSVLMNGAGFPTDKWCSKNDTEFRYLSDPVDVARAASGKSRVEIKETQPWFHSGFVHSYGMSSMHNDFNTYAELAMADPAKLKQLAEQYPKIRAKTKILVEFYTHLAHELGGYFEKVGLQFDDPAVQRKTVSR